MTRTRKVSRARIEAAIGVLGDLAQTDIPDGPERDQIASLITLLDRLSDEGGFVVPPSAPLEGSL